MKKIYTLLLILFTIAYSFGQDRWQNMMHDRSANFYEIQADFELYYNSITDGSGKDPKGKGIKQFRRWEYYWGSRVDENGNFPQDGEKLLEIQRYMNANISYKNYVPGTGAWEIVGPTASPSNGTGQPNGNGRLNCIAFHPTDLNTLYVGAPSGGIWKSIDGGTTWLEYSNGLTRLGVSSIVVHPSTPDTIYIGTGDRDGGNAPGYGVWRSTDGGLSWHAHNTGMGNRTVYEILMDPTDSNVLIASTSGSRIYRSTDGGANWSFTATASSCKDIAFHPTNSNIVYAGGTAFNKSTDNGQSFSQITSGVPTGLTRMSIGVSANQPDWIYIFAGGATGTGTFKGIHRSTNSGDDFSARTTTPNIMGYDVAGNDDRDQAWYDMTLAVDPTDANTIFTGGINIWKSVDGGTTMTLAAHWVGSGGVNEVHADHHVLEYSPHTNVLYNGNDGGIYNTTDGGANWNDITSGLAIAQIYKIGVSQSVSGLVINGYQDNGTSVSRDSNFKTEIGGDGMECAIDPTDENYMYGALYYGDIRRSTNNGNSFSSSITSSISENGGWVTPYKLDPNDENKMLAGFDNIWVNTDVKNTNIWTQISTFGGTNNIVDLAIAPSNSDVVYVSRSTGQFYRSTNATTGSPTWTTLSGNLPSGSTPRDIEIDPTDPTHLFIALSNNIYESTNSGASWTDYSGTIPNISLNTIVIDKTSPLNAMYLGMDSGVYYRDNTMADWELYKTGLPNIEVTELEIQYGIQVCENKLYAATYGQGLWKTDLKDPGSLAPVSCFSVNDTNGCLGSIFTLTDYSAYSPVSWSWTITPATFNYVGGTNVNSQNPQVEFTVAGTYTIELTTTNAHGNDTHNKPSYITVNSAANATSYNDDFEAESLCGTGNDCGTTICVLSGVWNNLSNGSDDNIDWRIDEGGTGSGGTGPAMDYNPGTATGNYAYLEASGGCTGETAILESNCINLNTTYEMTIGYHMSGAAMGSLHIDLFTSGAWINDIVTPISGDQGTAWNVLTVDLSAYVGEVVKLRVRGITGTDYTSDIAIDDIMFTTVLGVDDNVLEQFGITIYPNPAKEVLHVSNPELFNLNTITIYDLAGRKIKEINLKNMNTVEDIDITSLSPSVYIVKISSEKGEMTKQLIKR